VAVLLAAGLVATACSGATTTGGPTTTVPRPAGPQPSAISVQVCSSEAQTEMNSALGETARVSKPTWAVDTHLYSCTYDYPSSSPHGSFDLSVKELSGWSETYAFFDSLAAKLGKSRPLASLGQAAFQTPNGSVVVRKDWKVLVVDNSGLPPQFGVPPTSAGSVAVTVADVILGCWAGD